MGVDAVVGEAEVPGDGVGDLLAAVGEGEAGAGVRESLRDDGAEAAAGSGDGDHPSVEVGHVEDAIRLRADPLGMARPVPSPGRSVLGTGPTICPLPGGVPKRSNGLRCKRSGSVLRRFESSLPHFFASPDEPPA